MRVVRLVSTLMVLLAGFANCQQLHADSPPNFLVILVDDLGFSDLGCYGGEIETPNLDALAAGGLRFTQFYNTGRCWPTRGSLLTGYYAQQIRRDKLEGLKGGGGRGKRPSWAPLLPKLLKQAGYRSYHSGKWHVDGMPLEQGFDESYYLKDQGRFFSPKIHWLNDQRLPEVERGGNYYGTIAIADHAVETLQQHAKEFASKPFFHYLAFTAPHFPLHAIPEDIDKYRERYKRGWDVLRQERWERIQASGIVTGRISDVDYDQGAPYEFPDQVAAYGPGEVAKPKEWQQLTPQQQQFQATKMAIHAAMVDRVDQEIGRVLAQLKAMSCFDDTLIMFLSDNGCSAELMIRADGHDVDAAMGSGATHLCLGPGWSTVCNTPFRKHKTWVHEGGIATPCIAHWPRGITDRNTLRRTPAHVIDIVPTVLAVAGVQREQSPDAPAPPGASLTTVFARDGNLDREYLWWNHDNHKAIRKDNWKAVRTSKTPWELFDLQNDRAETNNLADQAADQLKSLTSEWKRIEQQFVDTVSRENR